MSLTIFPRLNEISPEQVARNFLCYSVHFSSQDAGAEKIHRLFHIMEEQKQSTILYEGIKKEFCGRPYELGLIYKNIKKNYRKAKICFRAAKDYSKLIDKIEKQIAKDNPWAKLLLGTFYYEGQYREKDEAKAAELYLKASRHENPTVQYILGYMYENGNKVEKNAVMATNCYRKARRYYEKIADFRLMYQNGEGVGQDYVKAIKYYALSGDQGQEEVESALENIYDRLISARKEGCIQNLAEAFYELGMIYYLGKGVIKNNLRAQILFQEAANSGLAAAGTSLGMMYYSGETGERIYKKAAELFLWAADQGDTHAEVMLKYIRKYDQVYPETLRRGRRQRIPSAYLKGSSSSFKKINLEKPCPGRICEKI